MRKILFLFLGMAAFMVLAFSVVNVRSNNHQKTEMIQPVGIYYAVQPVDPVSPDVKTNNARVITVMAADEAPAEAEPEQAPLWLNILNIVLGGLVLIAGTYWGIAKKKLGEAVTLLQLVVDAAEDNQLSLKEKNAIIAQAKKLISK